MQTRIGQLTYQNFAKEYFYVKDKLHAREYSGFAFIVQFFKNIREIFFKGLLCK